MSSQELVKRLMGDPSDNTAWMVDPDDYREEFVFIEAEQRLADQDLLMEIK